jgi:ABC-2 type transport system ATP-binding protein|tara:strand:- start:2485 stop:3405 length:921 start_codon:yes stop_codon:yes gene_type:complete
MSSDNNVVLSIKNLSKSFKEIKAVDNLTFDVHVGEIFGFLGPNGAGKSTTIRMALGLMKPDAGDVNIFDKSVAHNGNSALHGVGALIENAAFYKNLSAKRNLEILARLGGGSDKRINEVLDIVGLLSRAESKVKTYSHGMKQRLGIAQALLHKPKLLILDEPTTGLDPQGMKEVRKLILQMAEEGMTIFLSSHLLHEVEQTCSAMAIVNKGLLVAAGSVKKLLAETKLFQAEIRARPLEKAREIVENLDFVSQLTVEAEVMKASIPATDISKLTKSLVENGIEVDAIVPRTSLEDYFLSLTSEEGD